MHRYAWGYQLLPVQCGNPVSLPSHPSQPPFHHRSWTCPHLCTAALCCPAIHSPALPYSLLTLLTHCPTPYTTPLARTRFINCADIRILPATTKDVLPPANNTGSGGNDGTKPNSGSATPASKSTHCVAVIAQCVDMHNRV